MIKIHSVKTYNSSTTITKWMVGIQFNIILHYLIITIYTYIYIYIYTHTPIFTCTIEKQNTFTLFYSITQSFEKNPGPHPQPVSSIPQPSALRVATPPWSPDPPAAARPRNADWRPPRWPSAERCTRRKSLGPLRPCRGRGTPWVHQWG